ncbi:MAG: hypothetical protein IKT43_01710, partial [Clostridia bacterium]|nr:hypothetical protein [Clostridia bacterium]
MVILDMVDSFLFRYFKVFVICNIFGKTDRPGSRSLQDNKNFYFLCTPQAWEEKAPLLPRNQHFLLASPAARGGKAASDAS